MSSVFQVNPRVAGRKSKIVEDESVALATMSGGERSKTLVRMGDGDALTWIVVEITGTVFLYSNFPDHSIILIFAC